MSAIHDLIAQISDPRLRERLAAEWANAAKDKKFGLVFEDHLPELLPLHGAKPRKGDLVCRRQGALKDVWQVKSLHADMATCVKPSNDAHPSEATRAVAEPVQIPVDELLVVREFGEPIFPALVPVDAVANGPVDAPWHTLIEADNYHSLQLLDYLHAGQVDCIYIDPPYNTGARDWKYNNDYVDGNDGWRHSKWLAFMERRLLIAKRLLNPVASVLIVTIDEKEVLHLGILLEQIFPGCKVQKTTIVINPKGTARYNEFSRVEEYAFFVFIGDVKICPFGSDLLTSRDYSSETHALYDQHKKAIYKLKEQRRVNYEKLRLATAKPNEVPWHLPASIDFKRLPTDPLWERHLYVESNGQFRAELGSWEASVLKEELAKPEVVGWLRNLDRKPWSLEIPYETGGDIRPMFPDLVVVRKIGGDFVIDVLEPHDPSLSDNFEKAVGLAKFAEKHGALFGRIQLIRKQSSAGGEHFARLEINQAVTIKKLLLITSNPQLDELFSTVAK